MVQRWSWFPSPRRGDPEQQKQQGGMRWGDAPGWVSKGVSSPQSSRGVGRAGDSAVSPGSIPGRWRGHVCPADGSVCSGSARRLLHSREADRAVPVGNVPGWPCQPCQGHRGPCGHLPAPAPSQPAAQPVGPQREWGDAPDLRGDSGYLPSRAAAGAADAPMLSEVSVT